MSVFDYQEDINHKIESFYDTVSNVFSNLNINETEWDQMKDLYEYNAGR